MQCLHPLILKTYSHLQTCASFETAKSDQNTPPVLSPTILQKVGIHQVHFRHLYPTTSPEATIIRPGS